MIPAAPKMVCEIRSYVFWLKTALMLTILFVSLRHCEATHERTFITHHITEVLETSAKGVGTKCLRDMNTIMASLRTGEPWALKMLDSTGKLSDGILQGNGAFLGFYSECVDAFKNIPPNASLPSGFSSRYCLATFSLAKAQKYPPKGFPEYIWRKIRYGRRDSKLSHFRLGVCVPSSCTRQDVARFVDQFLANFMEGAEVKSTACSGESMGFFSDAPAILVSAVLGLFVALAIAGTLYDVVGPSRMRPLPNMYTGSTSAFSNIDDRSRSDGNIVQRVLLSFSFVTNGAKLLSAMSQGEDNIQILHGFRFYSMVLVIFGHAISMADSTLTLRMLVRESTVAANKTSRGLFGGSLVVDTFFMMSGLLVAYTTLKVMTMVKGKISWRLFYFHRYWRITPVMMAATAFSAILLPYLGSGPRWSEANAEFFGTCRHNWWINGLYIQNLVHLNHMCYSFSWYLAVDMQLYIISPIFLRLLYRKPRSGVTLATATIIASVILTGVISYVNDYPSGMYLAMAPKTTQHGFMKSIYIMPYSRVGPYLVGMLTGHYLHLNRGTIFVKRGYMYLGSTLSALIMWAVMNGLWPNHAEGVLPSRTESVIYNSLGRTLWAIGVAWMVFASLVGYGGVITKILCWKPLVPLSRLTYTAFIIHPTLYVMFYGTRQETLDASSYLFLYFWIGHVFLTYMVSMVVSLLFESPMIAMEKVFLPTRLSRKEVS